MRAPEPVGRERPAKPAFLGAVSPGGRWRLRGALAARGLQVLAFGLVPLLLTALQFSGLVNAHTVAVDFSHGSWIAGHRIFDGLSPYVASNSAQLKGITFVYPAVAALLLAPFSLLAQGTADVVFTMVGILAALATLRVLEVKDWRVYGVCLMWPAVMSAWETANVTLILAFGIALAWRYRNLPIVSGVLVALVVSFKLFLWPLTLWLIATKRYRALGYAALCGLVINLLSWAVLGFDQLARYKALMATLTRDQETRGYSLVALFVNHGSSRPLAYALSAGVAAVLAGACLAAGQRGGGRAALALSVACSLFVTPIVWMHYFALLLVPLALVRPRLAMLWLVPLLLQFPALGPSASQDLITLALAAAITALVLLSSRSEPIRNPTERAVSAAV
ncbi:MAG: DUF2029 domain-containing protein [Actinomycetota bacterium]|nr:DUF2029 domain-containing protein [Actinomycetota bacterium]